MEKDLNWAVLGTGVIANEMAQALQKMGKVHYIEQQGAGRNYFSGR